MVREMTHGRCLELKEEDRRISSAKTGRTLQKCALGENEMGDGRRTPATRRKNGKTPERKWDGERRTRGRVEREVSRARCFGKPREEPFPRFCDGMCGVVAGGHATACATRTCPD